MNNAVIKLERKFNESLENWYTVATYADGTTSVQNHGLTDRGSKGDMTKWTKAYGLVRISTDLATAEDYEEPAVEVTLKSGLEMMIDLVEKSDEDSFEMNNYEECVIGKTIAWVSHPFESGDWETVNSIFGLDKPLDITNSAFCPENSNGIFTDEEFSVIRLFTCNIGYTVSKEYWLKLAKKQLRKM